MRESCHAASRREFFRQGDDYYRAFNLRGPDGDSQSGPLPDGFKPEEPANQRALEILAARSLEESCRLGIAGIQPKQERGSLRKGAYDLARIIYLKQQAKLDRLVAEAAKHERKADVSRKLNDVISGIVKTFFDDARKLFQQALKDYLDKEGGNEDAALKNTEFAKKVDVLARPAQPRAASPERT